MYMCMDMCMDIRMLYMCMDIRMLGQENREREYIYLHIYTHNMSENMYMDIRM